MIKSVNQIFGLLVLFRRLEFRLFGRASLLDLICLELLFLFDFARASGHWRVRLSIDMVRLLFAQLDLNLILVLVNIQR